MRNDVDENFMDVTLGKIYNCTTKQFHIVFLSIVFVLTLTVCVGSFRMHASYIYKISEEQKKLLKTYAISTAIVSGLSFMSILYILYIWRKPGQDALQGTYTWDHHFDDKKLSVLVVGIFLAVLIISSVALGNRKYNMFFSLAENMKSSEEQDHKLFRYVLISPAVLLLLSVIYLILYGSYVISEKYQEYLDDV